DCWPGGGSRAASWSPSGSCPKGWWRPPRFRPTRGHCLWNRPPSPRRRPHRRRRRSCRQESVSFPNGKPGCRTGGATVGFLSLLLMLAADEIVEDLARKMLPVYVKEVSDYSLAVASAPQKALELKKEPIFEWSNPVRQG